MKPFGKIVGILLVLYGLATVVNGVDADGWRAAVASGNRGGLAL